MNKNQSNFITQDESKTLFENVFSLGIVQGLNYILPLITIPYLVRVLGPEMYGLTSFAISFIAIFALIANYGFNFSATKDISIHKEDHKKVIQIFSKVIFIKTFLSFLCFLLLAISINSFERFSSNLELFYLSFGIVLGQVITPLWLFQGLEKMRYIMVIDFISKIIFTVSIFLFVKNPDDYLLIPILYSLGGIVSGIFGLIISWKLFKLKFILPSFHESFRYFIKGWHLFVSTAFIGSYTSLLPFIVGLFANNILVGYFTGALKIIQALKSLFNPISQALFPLMASKIKSSKLNAKKLLTKASAVILPIFFVMSSSVFFLSETIVLIILGENFINSVIILKVMSFAPFFVVISNLYGIQLMINSGYEKLFSKFVIIASIIGLILNMILLYYFSILGAAFAVTITELLLAILVTFFSIRNIMFTK